MEIASIGVQVHGGMGFVEETGAAQYLRDARITTIYEGTTGIQANDLIGRKLAREKGATTRALIDESARTRRLRPAPSGRHRSGGIGRLRRRAGALAGATDWLLANYDGATQAAAAAGAVPYLKLSGTVAGGWLMARAALIALEQARRG